MIGRLHSFLADQNTSYHRWHKHSYHGHCHWLFAFIMLFLGAGVVASDWQATLRTLEQYVPQPVSAQTLPTCTETVTNGFVHPGLLNTCAELEAARNHIAASEQPWVDALNIIPSYTSAVAQVIPDIVFPNDASDPLWWESAGRFTTDGEVIYGSVLRWYFTGDTAHRDKAIEILNAWSSTLNSIDVGTAGQGRLAVSYGIPAFVWGAEILAATTNAWAPADQTAFKGMLQGKVTSKLRQAITRQNCIDGPICCSCYTFGNHHAWGVAARMAIGVYRDDQAVVDQSIETYKALLEYYLHPDGVTTETCRRDGGDLWHSQMGVIPLVMAAEVADNQGSVEDLYPYVAALDGATLETALNTHAQFVGYEWRYAGDQPTLDAIQNTWLNVIDGGQCTVALDALPGPGTSWWYGYEVAYKRFGGTALQDIVTDIMRNASRPSQGGFTAEHWSRAGFSTLTHGIALGPAPTPQCSDGIDNDSDGFTDFPNDPDCVSAQDTSETAPPATECSDGIDNDGNGDIDFPADAGCTSAQDTTEFTPPPPACSDGIDNDKDTLIDFPADPGCSSAQDITEQDTASTGKPDLIPSDIWWDPDPVNEGDAVAVGFRLTNIGNQTAQPPFHVTLTNNGQPMCQWTIEAGEAVPPGGIFERGPGVSTAQCAGSFGIPSAQLTGHTIVFTVDDLGQVDETNENNNVMSVVIAPSSCAGGVIGLGGDQTPDLDADGCVDAIDLSILLSCWGDSLTTC